MKFINVFLFSGRGYHTVGKAWVNVIVCLAIFFASGCDQKAKKNIANVGDTASNVRYQDIQKAKADSVVFEANSRAAADSEADRKLFQVFFEKFLTSVKRNDASQLQQMMYFPLQTAMIWTNDDLGYGGVDTLGERVWENEFKRCYPNIFYRELRSRLVHYKEDDLSELTDLSGADYYLRLQKLADKGAPIFEIYRQWRFSDSTLAGSYFGFVFGKVGGDYKVLSYYGKFPARSLSLN